VGDVEVSTVPPAVDRAAEKENNPVEVFIQTL
jgi:hypothetical protein